MSFGPRNGEYERLYANRIEARRKTYLDAKAATADVVRELKAGGFVEPDGSEAYRNALVAERFALRAYMASVKAFTDFVLHGKIAEDNTRPEG